MHHGILTSLGHVWNLRYETEFAFYRKCGRKNRIGVGGEIGGEK